MNKALLELLQNNTGVLSIEQLLMNFAVAAAIGMCVYLSYWLTHSGTVYSPRFNASLLMLTLVTTMVMNVIGNNIALSLGMVGALSIVRFRTAIKDPRDTTYIFWGIGGGLSCGVGEYYAAALGTGALFAIMLIFGMVRNNDRYLLVIHMEGDAGERVESAIHNLYGDQALLRVRNSSRSGGELIYELSRKLATHDLPDRKTINEILMEIDGVHQANLIMQTEEVSR